MDRSFDPLDSSRGSHTRGSRACVPNRPCVAHRAAPGGRLLLEVLLERVSEPRVASDFARQKVSPFWANGPTSLPLELVWR